MTAPRSTGSDTDLATGPGALPRRGCLRDYFRPSTLVFWGFHLVAIVGVILISAMVSFGISRSCC